MLEELIKCDICDYINNVEDEQFCSLTDKEVNEIAENIWSKVADDNELNNMINSTIEWYARHYIANHLQK